MKKQYQCGVLNCGNGICVHKLLKEKCPLCKMPLIEVTTTGFRFCSNHSHICDYEDPILDDSRQNRPYP